MIYMYTYMYMYIKDTESTKYKVKCVVFKMMNIENNFRWILTISLLS